MKKNIYLFIVIVALACAIPYVASPYLLRLSITIISGISVAMCLNVVLGYMGYPSLCQAVFYGVGGYTMALATLRLGLSPWAALVLSPISAFIIGYLVAIPFLKLRSMFFAIGTMALTGVVNVIIVNFPEITGSDAGLRNIPSLLETETGFFYAEMALLVLLIIAARFVEKSYWGKILVAIRDDENLAPYLGINTAKYKRTTFAVSAAATGVAGAIFMSYQTYINSNYFTVGASFTALAACVIGGAGTLLGPIYGGLVVIGLPETLRAMAQWRPSFIGAVLVAVIILSPGGVSRGLQMLGVLIGKRRETYKAAGSLAKRGKG